MVSDSMERANHIPPEQRLDVFALVIYIPPPLGEFLDRLRLTLVPGCNPHAHVSLLPPRPLAVDWQVASAELSAVIDPCSPFEIELTRVEVFPVTDVIYIEIGQGDQELRRLHSALNTGSLKFQDPFPYHPHITLAQELAPEKLAETDQTAQRMWREYSGPRRFPAEQAVFVKNSVNNCWIDLAEYSLGAARGKS